MKINIQESKLLNTEVVNINKSPRGYLEIELDLIKKVKNMTIEKIEKYLEEVSKDTGFGFEVEIRVEELRLYMRGDNPCGEEWLEEITIKKPNTKKKLIKSLSNYRDLKDIDVV